MVSGTSRDLGVDALRYLLAGFVILLHALPNPADPSSPPWAHILGCLCRAGVPFFFVASGAFLPTSRTGLDLVTKPLQRLLPIFAFWMIVYYILLKFWPAHPWQFHLKNLVNGGEAFHLWFLPALGIALVGVSGGLATIGSVPTGMICALLAAYALSKGAYIDLLHLHGTAARNGLLVAPLFVWIGTRMARAKVSLPTASAAVIASYAALLAEEMLLGRFNAGGHMISHDFPLATFALGASVFLLARSLPKGNYIELPAAGGRISLTIYTSHLAILWVLQDVIGDGSLAVVLLTTLLTFALATGTALLMRCIPLLDRLTA